MPKILDFEYPNIQQNSLLVYNISPILFDYPEIIIILYIKLLYYLFGSKFNKKLLSFFFYNKVIACFIIHYPFFISFQTSIKNLPYKIYNISLLEYSMLFIIFHNLQIL